MTRAIGQTIARSFRRVATPLCWYYAVTVAVPLANGAAGHGGAFIEHTLFVLVVPLVFIALASGGRALVRVIQRLVSSIHVDGETGWPPVRRSG